MKKALTLILALIMVMSLLVGCNNDPATGDKESSKPNNNQQASGSGNNDGSNPEESESETESEKIDYGIPDDLNYNDATIEVLGWNSVFPEWGVDADSMNGDPVASL